MIKKALGICLLLIFLVSSLGYSEFYAVKRTDITTSSVNFSFGFPAKVIQIQSASGNSAEVCIDWSGGTAVCPSADTAGDDRLPIGNAITLDAQTRSVSVIAASGTQIVFIRAWR